jgi:nucleoid-associated protein YgaU
VEYDYEPADDFEGRVLWGRVGVYAGTLLLMFILGNCLGGRGGGADPQELEFLQGQVQTLQEENAELQSQVDALSASQAGQPTQPADGDQTPGEGAAATEGDGSGAAAGEQTYVVQRGDTLYIIAQRVYGDGSKFQLIADANDIDSANRLTVGQELRIPPDPSA